MRTRGFTMVEMVVATAVFVAGAVYVYSTFAGVTMSTASATVEVDLNSQNKRALTALYTELQSSSVASHDVDGSGSDAPVLVVESDKAAPASLTKPRLVARLLQTPEQDGATWTLGESKEQAREKRILFNSRLRFRKVVGYRFNAVAGTIEPEWSQEVVYEVNARRQLVRRVVGGGAPPRVVAHHVDAFDVESKPDGTVVVTLVSARPSPDGKGFRRYANAVTVHPKN